MTVQDKPGRGLAVPLLGYLHRLLKESSAAAVPDLLQGIAEHFDASGAGFCSLPTAAPFCARFFADPSAAPAVYPWQENPALLQRLRGTSRALTERNEAGMWLLAQVWEPRFGDPLLCWMWRRDGRPWSDEAAAALPLAGQIVARQIVQEPLGTDAELRAWQMAAVGRKLDQAATLTSRLSHDFGNVLTGIMGFTELSLSQLPPDHPATGYLREVLEAARSGASWVQRLNLFCRRTAPPRWPTALPALVPEVCTKQEAEGAAGFRCVAQVPADLPLLGVEAEALRHILTELLANAREATHGQGLVTLSARVAELSESAGRGLLGAPPPGQYVEIAVQDAGPGLDAAARARLFTEIFFSTKPRYRGLGLLAVYGILRRCQGGLSIDPVPAGGTTVRVYLPVAAFPVGPDTAPLQGRILVVMDDAVARESVGRVLQAAGCQIVPAAGAHAALALYQVPRAVFDLVVTEVRLEHLTGFELARRIQDRDAGANFVFVQMQGLHASLPREERLQEFELLNQPFDPAALLTAARKALRRVRVETARK